MFKEAPPLSPKTGKRLTKHKRGLPRQVHADGNTHFILNGAPMYKSELKRMEDKKATWITDEPHLRRKGMIEERGDIARLRRQFEDQDIDRLCRTLGLREMSMNDLEDHSYLVEELTDDQTIAHTGVESIMSEPVLGIIQRGREAVQQQQRRTKRLQQMGFDPSASGWGGWEDSVVDIRGSQDLTTLPPTPATPPTPSQAAQSKASRGSKTLASASLATGAQAKGAQKGASRRRSRDMGKGDRSKDAASHWSQYSRSGEPVYGVGMDLASMSRSMDHRSALSLAGSGLLPDEMEDEDSFAHFTHGTHSGGSSGSHTVRRGYLRFLKDGAQRGDGCYQNAKDDAVSFLKAVLPRHTAEKRLRAVVAQKILPYEKEVQLLKKAQALVADAMDEDRTVGSGTAEGETVDSWEVGRGGSRSKDRSSVSRAVTPNIAEVRGLRHEAKRTKERIAKNKQRHLRLSKGLKVCKFFVLPVSKERIQEIQENTPGAVIPKVEGRYFVGVVTKVELEAETTLEEAHSDLELPSHKVKVHHDVGLKTATVHVKFEESNHSEAWNVTAFRNGRELWKERYPDDTDMDPREVPFDDDEA